MTEAEKVEHSIMAQTAINKLENVEIEILKEAWRNLHPNRKQALKKKLMALAFI